MSAGTIVAYQLDDIIVIEDCDEHERPFKRLAISPDSAINIGKLGLKAKWVLGMRMRQEGVKS